MPNRAAGGYEDKDDVDEVDARRAAIVAKVFAHSMLQAVDSCFFLSPKVALINVQSC